MPASMWQARCLLPAAGKWRESLNRKWRGSGRGNVSWVARHLIVNSPLRPMVHIHPVSHHHPMTQWWMMVEHARGEVGADEVNFNLVAMPTRHWLTSMELLLHFSGWCDMDIISINKSMVNTVTKSSYKIICSFSSKNAPLALWCNQDQIPHEN